MSLSFSDLAPEEKAILCDGCGAKGRGAWVPDFMFTASCDQHDFYYWRGGTEHDRAVADEAFYAAMKLDVARLAWWRRPVARFLAWRYFRAVRRGAGSAFAHGPERGRAELDAYIEEFTNR